MQRGKRVLIIGLALMTVLLSLLSRVAEAQGEKFSDVPPDAWYAEYVNAAVDAGIVSGYRDSAGTLAGTFGPGNRVTVAEILKIALESAGYDVSRGVGYGHWAAKYFSIALGEHFSLLQDPYLNPDRPALRAEVASLIADAFHLSVPSPEGRVFSDVGAVVDFAGAIEGLAIDQVVNGDTDSAGNPTGKFRPLAPINRAETVKIALEARARYGEPGNRIYGSSSSAFSSLGGCTEVLCGFRPLMPNWRCSDGSIAGPSCTRSVNGVCGWVIRQCPGSSSSSSSSSSRAGQTYEVLYTKDGFAPSLLVIRYNDTVRFRNSSGLQMWVASDPHPAHSDYPDFNQRATSGTGSTYSFPFTRVGTWGYHSDLKLTHQAVIVVNP